MTIPQEKNSTSTIVFVTPAKTRLRDLTGQRFGKLLVVQRFGTVRNKEATW